MAEANLGSLYELNKTVILKEPSLSNEQLAKALEEVKNFCLKVKDQYFLLLNRETYDITMFNFNAKICGYQNMRLIYDELRECLKNRGEIKSIAKTEARDAYEIWIVNKEKEALAYYFFPYDAGVIE